MSYDAEAPRWPEDSCEIAEKIYKLAQLAQDALASGSLEEAAQCIKSAQNGWSVLEKKQPTDAERLQASRAIADSKALYHEALASMLFNFGNASFNQGSYEIAADAYEKAVVLGEELLKAASGAAKIRHLRGLGSVLFNLGLAHHGQGTHRGSAAAFEKATSHYETLFRAASGDAKTLYCEMLADAFHNLGYAWAKQAAYEKAAAALDAAARHLQTLLTTSSGDEKTQYGLKFARLVYELVNVRFEQKPLAEAAGAYKMAAEHLEALFTATLGDRKKQLHERLADALFYVGVARSEQNAYAGAEEAYNAAVEQYENVTLYKTTSEVELGKIHEQLAAALYNLGTARDKQGAYRNAADAFEASAGYHETLYKAASGDEKTRYRELLEESLNKFGGMCFKQGAHTKAEAALEKAVKHRSALFAAASRDKRFYHLSKLAERLNRLGGPRRKQGAYLRAAVAYETAAKHYMVLINADATGSVSHREGIAQALYNLGVVLDKHNSTAEAAAAYEEAKEQREVLFEAASRPDESRRHCEGIADALTDLGGLRFKRGAYGEAAAALKAAIEYYKVLLGLASGESKAMHRGKIAFSLYIIGRVRWEQDAYEKAADAYEKACSTCENAFRENAGDRVKGGSRTSEGNDWGLFSPNSSNPVQLYATHLGALSGLAAAQQRLGRPRAAEERRQELLRRFESYRGALSLQGRLELQQAVAEQNLLGRLVERRQAASAVEAWHLAERARARTMLDVHARLRGGVDSRRSKAEAKREAEAVPEAGAAPNAEDREVSYRDSPAVSVPEPEALLGRLREAMGRSAEGGEPARHPLLVEYFFTGPNSVLTFLVPLWEPAGAAVGGAAGTDAAGATGGLVAEDHYVRWDELKRAIQLLHPGIGERAGSALAPGRLRIGPTGLTEPSTLALGVVALANSSPGSNSAPGSGSESTRLPAALMRLAGLLEAAMDAQQDVRKEAGREDGHKRWREAFAQRLEALNEQARRRLLFGKAREERGGDTPEEASAEEGVIRGAEAAGALRAALEAAEEAGLLGKRMLRLQLAGSLREALGAAQAAGASAAETAALIETLCAVAVAELRSDGARRSVGDGAPPLNDSTSTLFAKVIRQMAGILAGRLGGPEDEAEQSASRERLLEGSGDLSAKERLAFVRLLRQALAAGLFEGPGGRRLAEALRRRFVDALPAEIGRHFVAPWIGRAEELGATELILIPHGALHALPLEGALAGPSGSGPGGSGPGGNGPDGDALNGEVPLGERYPTSRAPSAATLAYMLDAPGRMLPQESFRQGGPKQDSPTQESGEARPVIVTPPRGAGLSYAPQEISSLSGLLREAGAPPQYAIDRPGQEQKAQLLTLCQEAPPRLLHVASHAVFTPSAPLSSYILLGGEDSGEEDLEGALRRVPLTLEEIFGGAMSLRGTSLAYLSACQSATSEPDVSDETFALSYGLTAAGARAVVATLWSVPDAVACAVAEAFYAAWVGEGRTAAEALQAGREAARRMPKGKAEHSREERSQTEGSQTEAHSQVQTQAGAYGFILIGNPNARF